jgi:hypothetical protein
MTAWLTLGCAVPDLRIAKHSGPIALNATFDGVVNATDDDTFIKHTDIHLNNSDLQVDGSFTGAAGTSRRLVSFCFPAHPGSRQVWAFL